MLICACRPSPLVELCSHVSLSLLCCYSYYIRKCRSSGDITILFSGGTYYFKILAADGKPDAASGYKVAGTQVVTTQQTGMADATTAIAADGAISAGYVQAEVEALRDAVAELQTKVNALIAILEAHGLATTV